MEVTKIELILINNSYDNKYGINDEDVKKANTLIKLIESTRDLKKPCSGDLIICEGPKKIYKDGHIEYWRPTKHFSVCTIPYIPFVSLYSENGGKVEPNFNSSGGYWFGVEKEDFDMFTYEGTIIKQFKTWGHCGAVGGGAFYFKARVNVWRIFREDIY